MKHDHHVTNMGARLGRFLGRGAKATIPVAQRQRQQANVESVPIQEPKADFLNRLKDVYVESKTETVRRENPLGQPRKVSHVEESTDGVIVPPGFLNIESILEIVHDQMHQSSGVLSVIKEQQISKKDVQSLQNYYGTLKVVAHLTRKTKLE